MSETKNLKLFKHDEPLETNENQFNIKKALHDNWDKLDEFGGKVNTKTVEIENKQKQHDTDISNIKQEQQDQNSKIESNTTESKDNAELLSQIMGLLPSTKGEGEHVTLDNTAEARFKNFQVQGNSKQETRSGKNKLPYPYKDLSSTVIQDLGDGRLILKGTVSQNVSIIIREWKIKAGKYKIVFNDTPIVNNSYFNLRKKPENEYYLQGVVKETTFEIPEDANVELSIVLVAGVYTNYPLNLMILEDTEKDKTFEQYGASPSLEFPSIIRNVGDNVNLFNKDENVALFSGAEKTAIATGVKITAKSDGAGKYCAIKLGKRELLGKTFITHGNIVLSGNNNAIMSFYFGNDKNSFVKWIADTGYLKTGSIEKNFTIPDSFPEDCDSIYINLYANGNSADGKTEDYVEYRDLKIEEGTQATAYGPYNCGNAEITVGNKNLANTKIIKNTNIITVNEDGSLTLANNSNTADMLEDTVIVYGGYNKTDKLQIQITKNAIGDYAQNEQQTILFPFTEGQKLYKGDYLAEDGIHHVRKQAELTETSGWSMGPLNAYRVPIQVFVGDVNRIIDGDKSIGLLSDRFVPKDSSEHTIGDEELYSLEGQVADCIYGFLCQKAFLQQQHLKKF